MTDQFIDMVILRDLNLAKLGRIVEQKRCSPCESCCGGLLSVIDRSPEFPNMKLYFTNVLLDDKAKVVEVRYIQDGMVNGHTSLSKPMELFAVSWLVRLGVEEEEEE